MSRLTLNEYQQQAVSSAVYPPNVGIHYPILGLIGEAGEVAEKWKKYLRGDFKSVDGLPDETQRKKAEYEVARELGDVLWYVAALARDLGFTLEEIANSNLVKIRDRSERGTLHGSGDDR